MFREVIEAERASFVRGWLATVLAIFAPLGLSTFLFAVSEPLQFGPTMLVGYVGALCWTALVIPYWFLRPPIVPPMFGLLMAATQWLLLALAIAFLTRRQTLRMTIVIALLAVIGVGVAVILVLRALGHRVFFESL